MRYYRQSKPYGLKKMQLAARRRSRQPLSLLAITCICTLSLLMLGFTFARPVERPRPSQPSVAVVKQGETLWDIASRVAGREVDIRLIVYEIRKLNSLSDASVKPGDVLRLPVVTNR